LRNVLIIFTELNW